MTSATTLAESPAQQSDSIGGGQTIDDNGGSRGGGNNGGRYGGIVGDGGISGRDCGGCEGRRPNNYNTAQVQSTNPITFEGDNSDVGAVLGLRINRFHKKTTFTNFK